MTDERMPRPDAAAAPGAVTRAGATPAGAEVAAPGAVTRDGVTPAGGEAAVPDAVTRAGVTPAGGEVVADAAGPTVATTPPVAEPADRHVEAAAAPTVEAPSPDIDLAQDASPLPGAHRGGFQRLPTAPVPLTVETAPAEPGGEFTPDDTQWPRAEQSAFSRGLAGWALAFAVIGLLVSMFVGWGFPIGLVAVVSAIIALRRPLENRAVAVWAIALGGLSILYSAGWLVFAALRANLFG